MTLPFDVVTRRETKESERNQELATPRQSFSSRTRDERMVGRVSSRSSTVTLPQVEDVLPGSDGAVQRRNGRGDECRSVDDYAVRGRRNVMSLESGDDRHVLSDGPCRLHPSAAKKYREDDREVRAEGQLRQRRRRAVPDEEQSRSQPKHDRTSTSRKWLKPDKFD